MRLFAELAAWDRWRQRGRGRTVALGGRRGDLGRRGSRGWRSGGGGWGRGGLTCGWSSGGGRSWSGRGDLGSGGWGGRGCGWGGGRSARGGGGVWGCKHLLWGAALGPLAARVAERSADRDTRGARPRLLAHAGPGLAVLDEHGAEGRVVVRRVAERLAHTIAVRDLSAVGRAGGGLRHERSGAGGGEHEGLGRGEHGGAGLWGFGGTDWDLWVGAKCGMRSRLDLGLDLVVCLDCLWPCRGVASSLAPRADGGTAPLLGINKAGRIGQRYTHFK